jgi:hypothetical protein
MSRFPLTSQADQLFDKVVDKSVAEELVSLLDNNATSISAYSFSTCFGNNVCKAPYLTSSPTVSLTLDERIYKDVTAIFPALSEESLVLVIGREFLWFAPLRETFFFVSVKNSGSLFASWFLLTLHMTKDVVLVV